MAGQDQQDVEKRLQAGEWLTVGDLMVLFADPNGKPTSRSSVDRWIRNGARFGDQRVEIRYQTMPSGERYCHPEDIAAVLAERQKIRTASNPDGLPQEPGA